MATKQDLGALRQRGLMTYGKAARKRQPKPTFTPTASEPASDNDSSLKPKTITRRRPALVTSPSHSSPSAKSRSIDRMQDTKAESNGSRSNLPSSDKKRKISQVYASRGRPQEPSLSEEDSTPPSNMARRSRTYAPEKACTAVVSNTRQRVRTSSESMDMDVAEAKLSSPPLTPTPPSALKHTEIITVESPTRMTTKPSKSKETKKEQPRQQQIPIRFTREEVAKSKPSSTTMTTMNGKVPSTSKSATNMVSKKPRKRLIDALVEQTRDEDVESVDDGSDSQINSSQPALSTQTSDVFTADSQEPPQTPNAKPRIVASTSTKTFTRSSSALKFTYGQGRRVLEEEEDNLLEALTMPEDPSFSLKGRRLELGTPQKLARSGVSFDDDDSTADGSPNSKLRHIHELRQAGANSRVADTMQDLADQMGCPGDKPLSSRRAALLQVAEKIKDKTFMRQCRDHGVEATLLKGVGKESDLISGYLILSTLVTILAKWPSSHIVQLLKLGNPANMFARYLNMSQDIKATARDRKSNLSKRSQNSIIAIQSSLCELPIWDTATPSRVSPRSLVLKLLQLLVTQDRNIGSDPTIFSPGVTQALFAVLSEAAAEETDYWNYPTSVESIDLWNALSVLDLHAVAVAESQHTRGEWASRYLPLVADVFGSAGRATAEESHKLEGAVLKLTINLTNNNLEAPDIFVSKGLIPPLVVSICNSFAQIWASLSQDSWVDGILDSLVLRLGILINFSEHSSLVRQVINDCHHDGQRPIDELIRLFLENYRRTAEADSMETSRLNVAFGYLSVLLGYLALHTPVRQKMKTSHSAKSIGPLLDSIREFIAHYKKVDQEHAVDEGDDGPRAHGGYAERLQELVHHLEDQTAYD
ncbi:hypothetical protein F4779DRAFT_566957 [Xylariaceae sp. FL0662B]|nr:hypothetical protein F4779DRAFT_566957 [Xylariaceae sp. FL0662B]